MPLTPFRNSFLTGFLLLYSSVTLVAPALYAQTPVSTKRGTNPVLTARNASAAPVRAIASDPGYLIGIGDVLSVDVWKEPEISRTAPVRPDGNISIPLLDDLRAAGLTPTQLASTITGKLHTILVDPRVTVMVMEINSRQVYILGEVTRAGAYPLVTPITVVQALSIAGGPTAFADVNKIYVLRMESDRQQILHFNYKDVTSGRRPEQNIQLQPGDTIVVP